MKQVPFKTSSSKQKTEVRFPEHPAFAEPNLKVLNFTHKTKLIFN